VNVTVPDAKLGRETAMHRVSERGAAEIDETIVLQLVSLNNLLLLHVRPRRVSTPSTRAAQQRPRR